MPSILYLLTVIALSSAAQLSASNSEKILTTLDSMNERLAELEKGRTPSTTLLLLNSLIEQQQQHVNRLAETVNNTRGMVKNSINKSSKESEVISKRIKALEASMAVIQKNGATHRDFHKEVEQLKKSVAWLENEATNHNLEIRRIVRASGNHALRLADLEKSVKEKYNDTCNAIKTLLTQPQPQQHYPVIYTLVPAEAPIEYSGYSQSHYQPISSTVQQPSPEYAPLLPTN